jgi:hypothetical protein
METKAKILIALFLLGVVTVSGCTQQQTKYVCPDGSVVADASQCSKPTTTTQTLPENLVLNDSNFNLVSLTWNQNIRDMCDIYNGILNGTTACTSRISVSCLDQYKMQDFVMTYVIRNPQHLQFHTTYPNGTYTQSVDCYVIVDGVKYDYHRLYDATDGTAEMGSWEFGVQPSCSSWGCQATADMTKDNYIALCCAGVCKSNTLSAYCK